MREDTLGLDRSVDPATRGRPLRSRLPPRPRGCLRADDLQPRPQSPPAGRARRRRPSDRASPATVRAPVGRCLGRRRASGARAKRRRFSPERPRATSESRPPRRWGGSLRGARAHLRGLPRRARPRQAKSTPVSRPSEIQPGDGLPGSPRRGPVRRGDLLAAWPCPKAGVRGPRRPVRRRACAR